MRPRTFVALGLACGALAVAVAPLSGGTADAGVNHQRNSRVELGRRLFFDPTASVAGQFACADCHDPEYGFTDRRVRSEDESGASRRHSQTLLELKGEGFHWDGEFMELEELLRARLGSAPERLDAVKALVQAQYDASVDADLTVDDDAFSRRIQSFVPRYYGTPRTPGPVTPFATVAIANRVDDDGRYDDLFKGAFGSAKVTTDRMITAMADYLGTLRATESPWDEYRAGKVEALTPQQRRGLALFEGKANCATCHPTRGKAGVSLSDGAFHNTGVAYRTTSHRWDPLPEAQRAAADAGHVSQTFAKEHMGRFKTPTLRDIATRPPYMHDGSFTSLRDVVDYYSGGGTSNEHLAAEIHATGLDEREREDVVAFLHALTGKERPGLGDLPRYRPEETRLRLLDLEGEGLPGLTVNVVPCGDRLRGTDEMPEGFTVTSDQQGWLTFPFPASTQVRLESAEYEIGLSRMIPDSAMRLSLVATPRDKIAVRVRLEKSAPRPNEIFATPVVTAGRTTDARIAFKRVRSIGRDQALYVADRNDVYLGLSGLGFEPNEVIAAVFQAEAVSGSAAPMSLGIRPLDLAGGQCEPIDLRPDPPFRERAKGPLGPRVTGERREKRVNPSGGGGGVPPGGGADPTGEAEPSTPDIGGSKGGGTLPTGAGGTLPAGPDKPFGR